MYPVFLYHSQDQDKQTVRSQLEQLKVVRILLLAVLESVGLEIVQVQLLATKSLTVVLAMRLAQLLISQVPVVQMLPQQ